MSAVTLLTISLLGMLGACQVAAVPADGDVLIMRYAWAPIFCYAGSANGVPKEFCGLEAPALQRFNVHRAGRISYSAESGDLGNCTDPTSGFNASLLSPAVRNALHCTSNSYSIGNDDAYFQFLWQEAGKILKKSILSITLLALFKNIASNFFLCFFPLGVCVAQQTGMTPKQ